MGFDAFLCEYGLFWALEEIFPKSMIMLTWCGSPMKPCGVKNLSSTHVYGKDDTEIMVYNMRRSPRKGDKKKNTRKRLEK